MPVTATPREIVEDYFERLSRRDESAFDLVAENFIQHAALPQGRQGLRQTAFVIDEDLGQPEIVIQHVVAENDLVCVHLDLVGTHQASNTSLLRPIVPAGANITWKFLHLFRVVDALITEHWGYHNDLEVRAQLGLSIDEIRAQP